jgi:NADP-dependent 3-hydroxy acid dehydrogenase YdfG
VLDSAAIEINANSSTPDLRICTFNADILNAKAMGKVFETVKKDFRLIDVLISNVGYLNTPDPIVSSLLDNCWHTFEVNVKGSIIVAQEFLHSNTSHANTTFINISSGAGHIPYIPDYFAYSASKLATIKVMEYLQH